MRVGKDKGLGDQLLNHLKSLRRNFYKSRVRAKEI